ncbi:(2Fe-2S)-binding protein [Streptomyces sp. TR06-5]|uniref:(2Fe-2S)-binding protein n=1 Tax=unclassified Streptomyces TaxID=2593676 RepID=UPI00399F79B2
MPVPAPVSSPPAASAGAPAPSATPLTPAYTRFAEVFPAVRISEHLELPRGGGWVTAADLAGSTAALDAYLRPEAEQVLGEHARPGRPDVIATFAFHRYAWPVCLLVTLPWFLHRRVPRLPLDGVALHRERGRLAVRAEGFACLPGDPAATLPRARAVADEAALAAEVRSAVADHLAPVLEGFRPRMRRGTRALWGLVTDEITEGLWYLGHLLGEEERARKEAELLLPGATDPFPGGAAFRTLTGPAGRPLTTRDRASCCLYYTLRPQDTCVTCPRTGDPERVARLTGTR